MWARLIAIIIGLWLMASASVLGYGGAARTCHVIVGALAVTLATIAIWEVTRPLRWINTALGVVLMVVPLVLGFEQAALVNSIASGVVTTAASLVRGTVRSEFGGGWSILWR